MPQDDLAVAAITIDASRDAIWTALTDPELIGRYMFGTKVVSDWKAGSPIVYRGEWEGKQYEDHGSIVELRPGELLRTTHFSQRAGLPDAPENYHELTWTIEVDDDVTTVRLTQDNNGSAEAAKHSAENWAQVLVGLKRVVEGDTSA